MIFTLLSFFWGATVLAATLPEANLVVTPSVGQVGKEFTFDASDSRNTSGQTGSLEFRFQFNQNQNWTPWATQYTQKFTPLDIGTYRVKVQVRDNQAASVQTTFREYRVVGDIFRKIWISVQPSSIRAAEPVYFELKLSLPRTQDPDAVEVRWDFNSDGSWDTDFSRQKIVEHVFSLHEVGQVSPTAEVRFPDGMHETVRGLEKTPSLGGVREPFLRSVWDKIRVMSPAIVAPVVNVSPGREGFTEETIFRFDASKSNVPAHAWLEWNFFGEQFVKGKDVVFHQFNAPGPHEVRIRVCYDRANPKCAETLVTVQVKENPVDYFAEISVQNLTRQTSFSAQTEGANRFFQAVVGDKIRFTAYIHQTDISGTRFTYRWDFEGDGKFDTTFRTDSSAEFIPPRPGTYRPTVQVQNEDLISTTAFIPLRVVANTTPRGNFTVDRARIHIGELVRFFPKAQDAQSLESRLETRFDADGDGEWDTRFRQMSSFDWRYSTPGNYVARMQVRDENERISTVSRMVTVYPYEKPVARVKVTPQYGDTQTTFVFDASGSTGQDLRFVWDFDYKGPNDLISDSLQAIAGTPTLQRQFPTPGERHMALTVIDGMGNQDFVHFVVWVSKYMQPAQPVLSEKNPHTENLFPKGPPMESTVPSFFFTDKKSEPNIPALQPRPVALDKRAAQFEFDAEGLDAAILARMTPDQELTRADMFFLLYAHELRQPPLYMEELGEPLPVFLYGYDHNILPLLTANPFEDVDEDDWFYMAAMLSYRDGYSQPLYFHPTQKVSAAEAERMVKKFIERDVDFGDSVTRQEFWNALH